MNIFPILLTSSITPESINKFSYLVGFICIIMVIINIWYSKELILYAKKEENKLKLLSYILYAMVIMMVSVVLLFLALRCFII